MKVVVHFDDHKKLEAFVALLAAIDKHTAKNEVKKKAKKTKTGPQPRGLFVLLIIFSFYFITICFMMLKQLTKNIRNRHKAYDRHYSFTTQSTYIPDYRAG